VDEALYSLERGYGLVSGAESYLRTAATCRVDFWLGWRNQARTHHFEAEFERLPDPSNAPILVAENSFRVGDAQSFREVELLGQEEDGFGYAVFVVIGEFAKEGKRVDVIALPRVEPSVYSAVRLESLKEAPVFWPEQRLASTFCGLPLPGTIGNRKFDPLRITWFPGSRKHLGELPGQLIKRRVKVLRDIGDGMGEVFSELADGRYAANAEHVVSRLRIEIGTDYCLVHWIVEGLNEVVFECGKVTMAPAQLAHGGVE